MRRASLLVTFSLSANVALAVMLWSRFSPTTPRAASGETIAPIAHSQPESAASVRARWETITSTSDDAAFVSQLRTEGFPTEVIRSLVRQRLYARYETRLKTLTQKTPAKPYWQSQYPWSTRDFDPATRAEQRAIWSEIQNTLQSLLGPDADYNSGYRREHLARAYGLIPSGKVSEIEAVSRDYAEMRQSIRDNARGIILVADREKLAFLEKEKRADIAAILSPEELDEYDRRNSPAAADVRAKFQFFESTEEDFLKVFSLQHDFDERYGRDNLSGEEQDRRKAAQPNLDRQIEAALGPTRYAEFQVANDINMSATRATMERIGLPPEHAAALVIIQRDAKTRAELIRNDHSLTSGQRDEQLAALQKKATDKASSILGTAENLDMFQRTAGQWLGKLVKPTNPDAR